MWPIICPEPHLLIVRRCQTIFRHRTWHTHPLWFHPERLDQPQKSTVQDLVLETLKTIVLTGWPEKRERCPIQVRDYWNYIEEISLHNAILFKSQRVLVPKAMRPERLSRIHSSHQGIASCLRNSVDMGFRILLFQTMVHRLAVRNFTSFCAAGNSTTWRQRLTVKLNLQSGRSNSY